MTMPATPRKGGATLMSCIGSVKMWGMRRQKGTSSTPSWWVGLLLFFFFSCPFLIYRSFPQPNHNPKTPPIVLLIQEPPCLLLHVNYQRHRPVPQHRWYFFRRRHPTPAYASVFSSFQWYWQSRRFFCASRIKRAGWHRSQQTEEKHQSKSDMRTGWRSRCWRYPCWGAKIVVFQTATTSDRKWRLERQSDRPQTGDGVAS